MRVIATVMRVESTLARQRIIQDNESDDDE